MHGQLTARSIADVCRELADACATGVLHIAGLEAAGRLVFDQGRLVAASSPTPGSRLGDRLVNGGLLKEEALHRVLDEQSDTPHAERSRLGQLLVDRGLVPIDAVRLVVQEQLLDAVFDLIGWREGTYRFEADAEPDSPEVPLAVPVDQALVEVARRREEWAALSEVIPDLDAVPRFREGATTSTADLEPDEFAVMASVDGLRSVRDLAYDLGYGEFEAARVVYALALLGLVEVSPPVDEIGAALDDALAYVGGGEPSVGGGTDQASAQQVEGAARPWSAPSTADDGAETLAEAVAELEDEPRGDQDPAGTGAPEVAGAGAAAPVTGTGAASPDLDWSGASDVEEPEPWTSFDEDPAPTIPGEAGAEETLEADLPDLTGFEELRLADRHEPSTAPPSGPEQQADDASRAEPAGPEEPSHAAPPAPHHVAPQTDGDVSEFLRELSRLALDDDEEGEGAPAEPSGASGPPAPSSEPRPRPRPATQSREEPKRKKRGLFGFGS